MKWDVEVIVSVEIEADTKREAAQKAKELKYIHNQGRIRGIAVSDEPIQEIK